MEFMGNKKMAEIRVTPIRQATPSTEDLPVLSKACLLALLSFSHTITSLSFALELDRVTWLPTCSRDLHFPSKQGCAGIGPSLLLRSIITIGLGVIVGLTPSQHPIR